MQKLRAALFNLLFMLWATPISLTGYVLALLHAQEPLRRISRLWCHGNVLLERMVLGLRFEMTGREHLPAGACIVAAAHQSMWETLKLPIWFKDCAIIVKRPLLDLPFWGRSLRVYGAIPVNRNRKAEDLTRTFKEAREAADNGQKLVVFPHGTRIDYGTPAPLQRGVAMFYEHLKLPVVPLQLNSGLYWPRKALEKRGGTIHVRLLPAIPPGLPRAEFMTRLQAALDASPTS